MDWNLIWQIPVAVFALTAFLGFVTKGSSLVVDLVNSMQDKEKILDQKDTKPIINIKAKVLRRDIKGRFVATSKKNSNWDNLKITPTRFISLNFIEYWYHSYGSWLVEPTH